MQMILPSQSAECIFSELSRGSLNSATLRIYMLHTNFRKDISLNGMGQNILLLKFSADM